MLFGVARAAGSQDGHAATEDKQLKFAIVSIRQNKARGPQNLGTPTPDGYEMKNMFLAAPILTAYVPQNGGASAYSDAQVIGLPPGQKVTKTGTISGRKLMRQTLPIGRIRASNLEFYEPCCNPC